MRSLLGVRCWQLGYVQEHAVHVELESKKEPDVLSVLFSRCRSSRRQGKFRLPKLRLKSISKDVFTAAYRSLALRNGKERAGTDCLIVDDQFHTSVHCLFSLLEVLV